MQIADMIEGPIKMVTFDLYDTLVESDPPGGERFASALRSAGFEVSVEDAWNAYAAGQRFFTQENGRIPIRDRQPEEIEEFRLNLTAVSMEELDLPTEADVLQTVTDHYRDETRRLGGMNYKAYAEVPEVLALLKKHKVLRGVISNADDDVTRLCLQSGFAEDMDIIVTSALVGWEKPDARTFYAALEPFNLPATRVLHVGDQPGSDVLGARQIGMAAALLDRYNQYPGDPENAERVTSLLQLAELVVEYNASFDE